MPLATGQTLTHYEILDPLGAGGMGEVWRARDTRLEREVAIKVLPTDLAAGGEALLRFEREARTLASLNHPNVAQVYGFDRVGDTCFIAMELVPGEDLAERLKRGPLRLDMVVDVGRQIAAGLEAAHEAGVIHRDLKPANVRRTPAGDVKVLDFGLAKPLSPVASEVGANLVTTQEGQLLGTPVYMAPEQARGEPLDLRVDVWAFGCVLFECLTGKRAFAGSSISEVLAAVLEREPDLASLPAVTPPRLRQLIERCLRKDPRRRLRNLGDARLELEELETAAEEIQAPRSGGGKRLVLLALGAVLLVAAGTQVGLRKESNGSKSANYRSVRITASQLHDRGPSWSPGGDQIAFSRNGTGSNGLYVMNFSSRQVELLRDGPGDEGFPRWSPDGKFIATLSTDLPGTPVILLEPPASEPRPLIRTEMHPFNVLAQWGALGSRPWVEDSSSLLVSRFTESGQAAIFSVGRLSGEVRQLTFPPVGESDLYGSYSFDGEEIAFVRGDFSSSRLMRMQRDGGEPEVLLQDEHLKGYPSWHPDGRRIFYLTAVGLWEFDVAARRASQLTHGDPDPTGLGGLSISADGRIAYSTGWHDTTLIRLDLETGGRETLTNFTGTNFSPRISLRGEIAYTSDRYGDSDIWVLTHDGKGRRITYDRAADNRPDWSPDGERLIFVSDRDGAQGIFMTDRFGGDRRHIFSGPVTAGGYIRWSPTSPAGELIGCIIAEEDGTSLWAVKPDGTGKRRLLEGVTDFDWYLDSRRVVCTLKEGRTEKLVAVQLETGQVQELYAGTHGEIDVAPDGSSVLIATGLGHVGMGRAELKLVRPDDPDGLPTAVGEPVDLVRPDGPWHTHHGCWAPDMKSIVYVHDEDRASIYELVEEP